MPRAPADLFSTTSDTVEDLDADRRDGGRIVVGLLDPLSRVTPCADTSTIPKRLVVGTLEIDGDVFR
ncbi:MAG: hypothetical protein ACE1Z9_07715 [Acidimicrobiia bacterium]